MAMLENSEHKEVVSLRLLEFLWTCPVSGVAAWALTTPCQVFLTTEYIGYSVNDLSTHVLVLISLSTAVKEGLPKPSFFFFVTAENISN